MAVINEIKYQLINGSLEKSSHAFNSQNSNNINQSDSNMSHLIINNNEKEIQIHPVTKLVIEFSKRFKQAYASHIKTLRSRLQPLKSFEDMNDMSNKILEEEDDDERGSISIMTKHLNNNQSVL